jgi:hypothetical protein
LPPLDQLQNTFYRFLPKTGHWIPPIPSQILAEIDNGGEDNSELDVLSKSMKEFAENLRARHDLHPAERVKVMKHLLEGWSQNYLKFGNNILQLILESEKNIERNFWVEDS